MRHARIFRRTPLQEHDSASPPHRFRVSAVAQEAGEEHRRVDQVHGVQSPPRGGLPPATPGRTRLEGPLRTWRRDDDLQLVRPPPSPPQGPLRARRRRLPCARRGGSARLGAGHLSFHTLPGREEEIRIPRGARGMRPGEGLTHPDRCRTRSRSDQHAGRGYEPRRSHADPGPGPAPAGR